MSSTVYGLRMMVALFFFLLPFAFAGVLVVSAPDGVIFQWFKLFEGSTHLEGTLLLIPWGTAAAIAGHTQGCRDRTIAAQQKDDPVL
ncbi:MAG: hypothetical protein WDZ82_03960 [Candidatus Paceibacterota bacterium]